MDATKGELLLRHDQGRARTVVVARGEGTRLGWWLCCIVHTERACQNFKAGRQMTWLAWLSVPRDWWCSEPFTVELCCDFCLGVMGKSRAHRY
jgi:hypothetical protein